MKDTKISRKLFFIALLSIFFINGFILSQNKVKQIDTLMKTVYERDQFNGCLLVAEDGKIIYDKAFGMANQETKDPLKINSAFQLASISKQFTAMAIMMLKERSKLNYEDSVTKYIPELPYKNITIRHLLTHTSGLPDYLELFREKWDTTKPDLKDRKIAVNKDVVELLKIFSPPVYFAPGEKYEYSNTGFLLLASIVEKVSGKEFDEFLKENIFDKLKMKNTLVYSNIKNQPMESRAYGYNLSWDGKEYIPRDIGYLDGTNGDKGVYSTIGDLFKWDRALYTEKLIKKRTLKDAFTRSKLNNDSTIRYGFGWFIDTVDGHAEVWHTGTWFGFRNRFLRQIDDNNTVIVLSSNTIGPRTEIVQAISNILHKKDYALPKIPISLTLGKTISNSGLDSAIHQYSELKEKQYSKYDFSEDELNSLGFKLLRAKKSNEAVAIFKLNIDTYPGSSNVYDSMGQAYIENGDKNLAIINYAKSLILDPKNTQAIEMLYKIKDMK